MNATELLEMLDGWPVEARPVNHWATVVGTKQHAGVDSMHIDHAVDLACMAGLRWLAHQPCPSTDMPGMYFVTVVDESMDADGSSWCVWLEWYQTEGHDHRTKMPYSGPTLLHAIDAAIRATK